MTLAMCRRMSASGGKAEVDPTAACHFRFMSTRPRLRTHQHVEYFGESRPSLSLTDKEAAMTHLFWLSDDAWVAIEPHLPQGKPGKPRVDDRRVISGSDRWCTGCGLARGKRPKYGP